MLKRFKGVVLAVFIMPIIAFSGCDFGDKEKDNSAVLFLLLASSSNYGSVDFSYGGTDTGGSADNWRSGGFGDPGSGSYQQASSEGAAQFWIILTGGHAVADYDQDNVEIIFNINGYSYTTVTGRAFTLSISSWPGEGGFAEGTFSGTLERVDNSAHTATISGGTFRVKILN
ncbi:MAG: hypothetical protein JW807_07440 [Spirochaetes bacterium]|nr:hypothetical protein [Spirochaetota bacterium]